MGLPTEEEKALMGTSAFIEVDAIGISDLAVALRVKESNLVLAQEIVPVVSSNKVPHITLLVNKDGGGRPVDSNNIEAWVTIIYPHQFIATLKYVE